jgi:hypothetical protein
MKKIDIVKFLIKEMNNEELKGGQKKLDVAPPFGKLTGDDFKALQAKKKKSVEEHHNDPNFPGGPMIYALLDRVAKDWGTNSDIYNYLEEVIVEMFNDTNKEINEQDDHEVSMGNNSLDSIIQAASDLKAKLGNQEKDIPAWIQDHITNAENYINQAAKNYHEYGSDEMETGEENLQEMDMNDPIMMKMRAPKPTAAPTNKPVIANQEKLALLLKSRDRVMRDMEQEAEPEGGPIAATYGELLNRLDQAIAKLRK